MTKYLLALDISTSCTGWCLFDISSKKLYKAGAIETPSDKPGAKKAPKFPDLFAKVDFLVKELTETVCKDISVSHIAVEQALKKLSGGSSNADTIGMLIQYNFCVMYNLVRKLKTEYLYYDVRSARKTVGITVPRGADAKKCVMNVIKPRYSNLEWKLNKAQNLSKWCFDMADAIVIGEAAIKDV